MAGSSSDYHHGEMNVSEQQATFHLVMGMTKWGSLVLAVFLLFVVIWFCTPIGFGGGFISGIAALVLGIALLREKKDTSAH